MVTKTYLKPTYLPTYATVVTVVTVVIEVTVVTVVTIVTKKNLFFLSTTKKFLLKNFFFMPKTFFHTKKFPKKSKHDKTQKLKILQNSTFDN